MTDPSVDIANLDSIEFDPKQKFYTGSFNARRLVSDLKSVPALADFDDSNGNRQSAVYLQWAGDGSGIIVVVPAGVSGWAAIDAKIAAHDPTPDPYTPE